MSSEAEFRGRSVKPRYPLLIAVFLLARASVLPAQGSTYDCLTTPNGIPRKVIVKKQNVAAYEGRDFTGRKVPMKFFRKYFVFRQNAGGYEVGESTSKSTVLGWVRRDRVLPWDTEQAIFFINKKAEGRAPIRIWLTREDVGNHDKPCFEEQLSLEHTSEPFPILSKREAFVKVAFLWDAEGPIRRLETVRSPGLGGTEGANGATNVLGSGDAMTDLARGEKVNRGTEGKRVFRAGRKITEMTREARRMDIVLVMDVTGSMGPYMEQVRDRLLEITQALYAMDLGGGEVEIRVGMVAYRDYLDGKTSFVTKALNLTKDHAQVKQFLAGLKPSGGGGINEAVCEGLYQAYQSMNWGERSYRVMCLIGDAPPHEPDDKDSRYLKKAGAFVQSDFFGQPFNKNVAKIQETIERGRIQLFALGVGDNPDMMRMFPVFVKRKERFLQLANADEFIRALRGELRQSRVAHDEALQVLQSRVDPVRVSTAPITDDELEKLKPLNIDPDELAALQQERMQMGWFRPEVGNSACVCVYMKRRELEVWANKLRMQLLAFREKQNDIFQGILDIHARKVKLHSINDLYRVVNDIAYQPEMLRLENLSMADKLRVRMLRKKLNNIEILLLTDKLFNRYEEGWVPIDYLPGSVREFRTG